MYLLNLDSVASCKAIIYICYKYLNRTNNFIQCDPGLFWNCFRSFYKRVGLHNAVGIRAIRSDSDTTTANLFASYFSEPYYRRSICKPKGKLSRKLDSVNSYFLRSVVSLFLPLYRLFNLSLRTEVVPSS